MIPIPGEDGAYEKFGNQKLKLLRRERICAGDVGRATQANFSSIYEAMTPASQDDFGNSFQFMCCDGLCADEAAAVCTLGEAKGVAPCDYYAWRRAATESRVGTLTRSLRKSIEDIEPENLRMLRSKHERLLVNLR